jgi:hypothetical protein
MVGGTFYNQRLNNRKTIIVYAQGVLNLKNLCALISNFLCDA